MSKTKNQVIDQQNEKQQAIAAMRERRHYIGFELNREYFDKAQQRIAKEKQSPTLF